MLLCAEGSGQAGGMRMGLWIEKLRIQPYSSHSNHFSPPSSHIPIVTKLREEAIMYIPPLIINQRPTTIPDFPQRAEGVGASGARGALGVSIPASQARAASRSLWRPLGTHAERVYFREFWDGMGWEGREWLVSKVVSWVHGPCCSAVDVTIDRILAKRSGVSEVLAGKRCWRYRDGG